MAITPCCAKNGDLVTRHNALRNLVHSIASDGLLQPQLEKQGILGPTTGRRPGDVPDWKNGNALAIDVAVTSPLAQTSVRLVNPCENYSETQKHRKYDVSFEGTDYYFCALVFETLGGVNAEGEKVLRQLFTFAAKKLGREFSSYCSRAWARVSCCLQRSVAQMILSRIDGVSTESELPSESFAVVSGKSSVGEWSVGRSSIGGPFSEFSVGQSIGVPSAGESSVVLPVEQKGKQLPSVVSQSGVEAKPVAASQSRAGAKPSVASQSKAERSAHTQSKAEVQQPGTSEGGDKLGGEKRGGEGGIMNTTHTHTIRTSPLMSCKNSIGRAGPGDVKQASYSKSDVRASDASKAGSRDLTYVPNTPPPSLFRRGSVCHANGRSNSVTRTRVHHTGPKSTGGHPLLVGTLANASPNAVLPSLEIGFGQDAHIAGLAPGPLVLQEDPPLLGAWISYKAAAKFFKIR